MSAAKKRDTFLDLTMHGRVPEILRELAERIERGDTAVEAVDVKLRGDIAVMSLELNTKGTKP